MARHFDIPIAFEYLSRRVAWSAYSFTVVGRTSVAPKGPVGLLGLIEPPYPQSWLIRFDQTEKAMWPGFQPRRLYRASSPDIAPCLETLAEVQLSGRDVPESMRQLLIACPEDKVPEKALDPWRMRDEFFRLEETNLALLSFLNRWGLWDSLASLHIDSVPLAEAGRYPIDHQVPVFVLPFLVWRRKKMLREAALRPAEAWLTKDASLGTTHRRSRFPYVGITDKLCVKAIETAITLDHMRAVKNRICARPDCSNIFTVDSAHGKVYCEQYCAHVVSQRRKRAAAKLEKRQGKQG